MKKKRGAEIKLVAEIGVNVLKIWQILILQKKILSSSLEFCLVILLLTWKVYAAPLKLDG